MEPRARLSKALKRTSPDQVPMYFEFTPYIQQLFEEKTGAKAEHYQQYFKFDMVSAEPDNLLERTSDFKEYYQGQDMKEVQVNEWGIGSVKGSLFHFERLIHPLSQAEHLKEILDFPFPVPTENNNVFKNYMDKISELHRQGLAVMSRGQCVGGTVFWPAYKLRGLEQILIDMYENEELLTALLDKVTAIMLDFCCKKAEAGVDVLYLADDFGTQRGLMMSYPLWVKFFKERLHKIISAVKKVNPEIFVAFHSDGNIEKIIPDLIEIGVDVLNPLQPECMDIFEIKKTYGDRLSFWGTIGTQTTMPFGTTAEVDQAVKRSIQEVGSGGGLIIGPTHVIEPEVPWENIMAFVEAVDKYGRY